MANRTGKGQFNKNDKRINRDGRPKGSKDLGALFRRIGHEVATKKDGSPLLGPDGKPMTVIEAIARQMAQDHDLTVLIGGGRAWFDGGRRPISGSTVEDLQSSSQSGLPNSRVTQIIELVTHPSSFGSLLRSTLLAQRNFFDKEADDKRYCDDYRCKHEYR